MAVRSCRAWPISQSLKRRVAHAWPRPGAAAGRAGGRQASPKIFIPAQPISEVTGESASVVVRFLQCGLDVVFERGRYPGSC